MIKDFKLLFVLIELIERGPEAPLVNPISSHHLIQITNLAVLCVKNVKHPIADYRAVEPLGKLAEQMVAKHHRAGLHKVSSEQICNSRDLFLIRRTIVPWLASFIFVKELYIMKTDSKIRMVIQEVRLLLQFVWISPVIIPIEKGQILPLAGPKAFPKVALASDA